MLTTQRTVSTQTGDSAEACCVIITPDSPSCAISSLGLSPVSNDGPRIVVLARTPISVELAVIPPWFDPVPPPNPNEIRLPQPIHKMSHSDRRTYNCLINYRLMTKEKSLDFVQQPFCPSFDNTETLIIVMDFVTQQLGIPLSFSNTTFDYQDASYRAACGVGNLGSIHSITASSSDIQTAKFEFLLDRDFDDMTRADDTIRDFTLRFVKAIATAVECKVEFVRVFSLEKDSSSKALVKCGITTESQTDTLDLAKTLSEKAASRTSLLQDNDSILSHIVPAKYEFVLAPALNTLQLQKDDFDPRYNQDYTNTNHVPEKRGGRPYYFPNGWYRHAIKVKNKYPKDELWLGMKNSDGEWRVAFHGTGSSAVKAITHDGFKHDKVSRDAYRSEAIKRIGPIANVKGIYLATHCEEGAAAYAQPFPVKMPSGETTYYRMVFQCRVQPGKYTKHSGPVSLGKALRVFDKNAIRPYGILLQETTATGQPKSTQDCTLL